MKEVENLMKIDERKRPYNSMKANGIGEPTPEEMEAYMRKKQAPDDPMFGLL